MKGSLFDYSAEIIDEANGGKLRRTHACIYPGACDADENLGMIAARIDRKLLSGKDIFFGQQTYAVQISPGYDQALIAAMCICLDEKNNEA